MSEKTPQEQLWDIIDAMPGTEPSKRRKAANLLNVSWATVWRWEHETRPIRGGNVTAIKLIWERYCAPKKAASGGRYPRKVAPTAPH